jgi:hypothetical protein
VFGEDSAQMMELEPVEREVHCMLADVLRLVRNRCVCARAAAASGCG